MRDVILNWQLGTNFGWGLLGLNLFAQWANDARLRPVMGCPIEAAQLAGLDALRIARILTAVNSSNEYLQHQRERNPQQCPDAVCIDALGNDFQPASQCRASFMIARTIFETTSTQLARERLEKYALLLTASTWNAALLWDATGREARVIHEGVDVSTFCPGPRSGWLDPERFYVFSGGKVEFRKAQDLVLLAFKGFAARHADAVLVTAWHSPWPDISRGFRGLLAAPLTVGANGMLDVKRWVVENGIDAGQVLDLGAVPNVLMPGVLREMHVALQPSRAEACTNLPVKEAMACGVPVIAARNTGMLDLLTDDNCIMLRRQSPVNAPGPTGTEGWGESDVEEMDAALEFAYQDRRAAAARGAAARQWLLANGRTWQQHAATLKDWVLANAP
jgi:glycosyltransferase involved in cell wall biosynthesis